MSPSQRLFEIASLFLTAMVATDYEFCVAIYGTGLLLDEVLGRDDEYGFLPLEIERGKAFFDDIFVLFFGLAGFADEVEAFFSFGAHFFVT